MGRVLERAYAAFGEEARRRGIDYSQEANGGAVIYTDGDRVLQIISNLLANAFRWTPDGGRIELELEAVNGDVSVAVADSGPGNQPRGGGADLPAVLVARRRRHRPRPRDRERARQRARRPHRARQRSSVAAAASSWSCRRAPVGLASAPPCRRSRRTRSGASARRWWHCPSGGAQSVPLSSPCVPVSGRRTCCSSRGSSSPQSSATSCAGSRP